MGGPYRTRGPEPDDDPLDEPERDELTPVVTDRSRLDEIRSTQAQNHKRGLLFVLLIQLGLFPLVWSALPTAKCKTSAASTFPNNTSFAYPVDFEVREATKRPDSIRITEVRGTAPRFEKGETYLVRGDYTLMSRPEAVLLLTVLSVRPLEYCLLRNPYSQVFIARGSGRFELATRIPFQGYPTLRLVDEEQELGRVYFGKGPFLSR